MKIKKFFATFLSVGILMTSLPFHSPTINALENSMPDPVMKVTFDDGTANDVTGRGNNGTIYGEPEFVDGISGKAVHLVNPEDVAGQPPVAAQQYIDFGTPEDLQFGEGNFSIAFWYKSDRPAGRTHKEGAIVSNKNWNSGQNAGFNIGDMRQGINFNFNTDGSLTRRETDRFAEAVDGEWHHIAATVDRNGTMVLYVDGEKPTQGSGFGTNQSAEVDITDRSGTIDVMNFVVGADGKKELGVLDIYLDELSVYKTALTEEQVKELSKVPDGLPDPVMKVTFDDATAMDVTGRGNNGTVYGEPEFVDGVSGKAVHLVNPEDVAGQPPVAAQQYIDFGTPEDLQFGEGNFSIAFWYKSDRPAGRTHKEGAIVSNKNWNSGQNAGFNIGDMRQGINFNFNTDGSLTRRETDRFAEAVDGQWHHIAATVDRNGTMVLYVDGEKPTQGSGFGTNQSAEVDITDRSGSIDVMNFVVGADGKKELGVLDIYLDELSVYKVALTEEQVRKLSGVQEVPKDSPVLYASFDGSDAKDDSGRGNDGTVMGSPEFPDGVVGKAIHLTNSGEAADSTTVEADQYVNFGTPDDLQFGADDFSIMFWYKSDGADPAEVSVVSNKNWNSGGNPGFTIGDMRNGMTLNFTGNGQSRQDTGRISAATDNTWHHIAATYDRDGNMILYVDGDVAATVDISKQRGAGIDMYDFVLGADGMKRQGVTDSWIDELYVYKRVLSQKEIQDYNAPFVLQNLIAEYEEIAETSEASPEKVEAFKEAIADVKREAEGVTDLQQIEELTARLEKAFDAFWAPEDGIIHFEVISDVHIASSNPNHLHAEQFRDMLSDMERDYPDSSVILNCGDFTENGSEEQAAIYFDILEENDQFSYMTALGNHDVRWRSGWDEIEERYLRLNGPYMGDNEGKVYYDHWIDGYHFIVLNTEWDIKDRAYISPEQLAWLDATMAEGAEEGKPIFVVMHQPLNDTFNMSDVYPLGMQDYALKEVLRKYPQTILFTGHVHNGMGMLEIMHTDYGTLVDVPSLRSNNQGDSQGQIGYHVTVYEDKVQLNLRNYRDDKWVVENTYTIPLDSGSYPVGKVLDVDFDEGTAADESGYGNNGTLAGDPEFAEGFHGGKALHIVNSEEAAQYVDFGSIPQIDFGSDDFTVMFQYKAGSANNGSILGNKQLGAAVPGFAVGSYTGETPGIGLEFSAQDGALAETEHFDTVNDGNWHAVAATIDRSGEMILYIDGKEAGRQTIDNQESSAEGAGLNLILGADGLLQNGVQDMYVDNLKVYRSVLGPDELESSWAPFRVDVGASDVTISWELPFDEKIEPGYLVLDGEKVADIASGEASKTISGLTPGQEYTILLVTREKAHSNNFRDVYPFVVTIPEPEAVNKSTLEYVLNIANNHVEAGDVDKLVPSAQEVFNKVLASAQAIYDDPDATQEQVDTAWKTLMYAIQAMGFVPGDKTELKKVIDEADIKNSELDRYVDDAEAKQKFADALAAAKEVYEKDGATQEEIDQVKNNLIDAMTGLRLRADKDNLNKWLEDLKSMDLSQYTEESAAVVRAVIAKAEALAAQDLDENDQDLINAMVAEMAIAKAQLVPAPADPEDPENPNPGDGSGESSNPENSKPNGDASSQSEANSEGKEATDDVPTTGDSVPVAAMSLLAVAAAGTVLLIKKRKS